MYLDIIAEMTGVQRMLGISIFALISSQISPSDGFALVVDKFFIGYNEKTLTTFSRS